MGTRRISRATVTQGKRQRRWKRGGSAGRQSPRERDKGDGNEGDQQGDSHLGKETKVTETIIISRATVI